jgi:hypothetical protein
VTDRFLKNLCFDKKRSIRVVAMYILSWAVLANHFPTVASYLMRLKILLMLQETRRDKIFVCLTMPGYAKYHSQTGKSPEEYIALTDGDNIPIDEFIALSVFLLIGVRLRKCVLLITTFLNQI